MRVYSLAERLVTIGCILGGLYIMGLNLYESGYSQGKQAAICKPKIIHRVDNYSPVELRRIASARERMERVK